MCDGKDEKEDIAMPQPQGGWLWYFRTASGHRLAWIDFAGSDRPDMLSELFWKDAQRMRAIVLDMIRRATLPKPEQQAVDPYAELKVALAAGKTIQMRHPDGYWWVDIVPVLWCLTPDRYRVKPEQPAAEQQATPDADGWIPWAGGERPVDSETIVEVRHRNGMTGSSPASWFAWNYETNFKACGHEIRHNDCDIVAYRVVKAAEQPATPAADAGDQPDSILEQVANYRPASNLNAAINPMATACATGDDGPVTAHSVLARAANHMSARAATYDSTGGERSMANTVAAFNAITGLNLTEAQGWLLLQLLKLVRLCSAPGYHQDSAEDNAAYAALLAEAKAREAAEGASQ